MLFRSEEQGKSGAAARLELTEECAGVRLLQFDGGVRVAVQRRGLRGGRNARRRAVRRAGGVLCARGGEAASKEANAGKELPPLPYLLVRMGGGSGSIVPRSPRSTEVTAAPRATRSFVAITAVECSSSRTRYEAPGYGVAKVHSSALTGCDWRWARATRVVRKSEQLSCALGTWRSGATRNVQNSLRI